MFAPHAQAFGTVAQECSDWLLRKVQRSRAYISAVIT